MDKSLCNRICLILRYPSGQRREFTMFRFFDALKLGGKGSHSNGGGGGVYLRALSFESLDSRIWSKKKKDNWHMSV